MIKKVHAASSEGLRKYTIVKRKKKRKYKKQEIQVKSSAPKLNKASLSSLQTIVLIT